MDNITSQQTFRPAISKIRYSLDYRNLQNTFIKIDKIFRETDLEHKLVCRTLKQCNYKKNLEFHYKNTRYALRCNIARHFTGESYRAFSIRLADSKLFQWFTGMSAFGYAKAVAKSSLERYDKYFDEKLIAEQSREWLSQFSDPKNSLKIGLNKSLDFSTIFTDSTCIKANIHFPIDWVLLKDVVRSLILAIGCIRSQGLKNRMNEPSQFIKNMNHLCIEMTHTRRKKGGKKYRKEILRKMKKLTKCVQKHAERYRILLVKQREQTNWTEAQAKQVIKRIDNILDQLPAAIEQAHERIIGERAVPSNKKILSLYDHNAQVIVRGKAGNEVEFGQGLMLTEQKNGLIVDWELFDERPPADNKALESVLSRIKKSYGPIQSICADRGFSSKDNEALLKEHDTYNAICPKSPVQLKEKLSDPIFVSLQTRRSQTEARIGIFKNVFLGKPLRTRDISNKRLAVTWCVVTHNLWVMARMVLADEKSKSKKAA